MMDPIQKLTELYQQMYELTEPECAKCRASRSCCSPEYCQLAMQRAAEFGVTLTPTGHDRLPLMLDESIFTPKAQQPPVAPLSPRVQLERWLPITGYEGLYEVSSDGGVRRCGSEKCLKPIRNKYPYVFLYKGGVKKKHHIHILVCTAFKGPKPTLRHEVNHRDGDTQNFWSSNLEWLTKSENMKHAFKLGLKQNKTGADHPQAKFFKVTSPDGDVSYIKGLTSFCRDNDLSQGAMSSVASGKYESYKGWKCEAIERGCIAPPHLRPLCTLHTCDMSGLGFKRDDPLGEWTDKYFELRNEIDEFEIQIYKKASNASGSDGGDESDSPACQG